MASYETLFAFLAAASIFAYMPGPSTLYAAAQTIARGKRAGWFAALGIHLGGYVHVIAVASGVTILFEIVPILFTALKFAGAMYLIWLGLRMVLAKAEIYAEIGDLEKRSTIRAFWESVSVEVLNPKTAIFYLAFLPQFVDPTATFPVWAQLLILGTIVNVMFSSADVICVVLAEKVTSFFKTSKEAGNIAQKIGGGILVGLGLHLAFNRS